MKRTRTANQLEHGTTEKPVRYVTNCRFFIEGKENKISDTQFYC